VTAFIASVVLSQIALSSSIANEASVCPVIRLVRYKSIATIIFHQA
jgi:hypothetical protein